MARFLSKFPHFRRKNSPPFSPSPKKNRSLALSALYLTPQIGASLPYFPFSFDTVHRSAEISSINNRFAMLSFVRSPCRAFLLALRFFSRLLLLLRIIPKALMSIEITDQSVGGVKVVADMHERTAEIARAADAFISLPGYATMEELLEMITWYS